MLLFILLFISVLFMGGALFSIVLHFSRKKESVFHDSDEGVFVLQKEDKRNDPEMSDDDSTEKHDILESVDKERSETKFMNTIAEKFKLIFGGIQSFLLLFISKSKSAILKTIASMSSLFSKFNQIVKDQISALQERQGKTDETDVAQSGQDLPSDEDFASLYDESEENVSHRQLLSSENQQKPSLQEEDQMPKKVSQKDMSAFLLDTEDDMIDSEIVSSLQAPVDTIEKSSELDVNTVPEPQKKADSFVKGLMDDDAFHSPQGDAEDAISDNYYYTYMEKRYIKKIVSNPKDVEVYRKLGDLYLEMENYTDAQASFEQVLRLKPADKHAILALKELEDHL